MSKEKDFPDFPYDIEDDCGELSETENLCPGVYYVANTGDGLFAGEFYIVEAGKSCLSDAVITLGLPLPHHPELLFYPMDAENGGHMAVQYESLRYRLTHDLPVDESDSLHTVSVFGMEVCPAYFGDYPVPSVTPRGFTTRHQELLRGVFALETDQCEKMIAVCYPIWTAELSDAVVQNAEQIDLDRLGGIHNTLGVLFFPLSSASLALFELTKAHDKALRASGLVNMTALMNAVWESFPEYAAMHNLREQSGLNDGAGLFLRSIGGETDLSRSQENMISVSPGSGTDYLLF